MKAGACTADTVFVDIGYKTEGVIPLAGSRRRANWSARNKLPVSIKGATGRYRLSRLKVDRPKDWSSLEGLRR
jgi:small subunit ribosomal protein S1